MKFQAGIFTPNLSGSAGGTTASRNRSGGYFRNKAIPTNPDTVFQQAARAILAAFSQAWRGLTQAQRDAFDAAVNNFISTDVFGVGRRKTGKNLYTSLNANLAAVGQSAISAPPLPVAVPSAGVSAVAIAIGAGTFDVTFTDPAATESVQVWATAPLSAGVSYAKNQYRQIDAVVGGGGSPLDFSAAYLAKFGVPPVGTKVFVKLVIVNNASGIKSTGSTGYAIVAA